MSAGLGFTNSLASSFPKFFSVEYKAGDSIPFAQAQQPPTVVPSSQLFGKVKKFFTENGQTLVKADVTVECSWQPDFLLTAIAVSGQNSSEDYIGSVADGVLVIDDAFATKYFKADSAEASRRIRAYRTQRR